MKLVMKRNSRIRFFALLALLFGLIFVRYVFQISFPRQILLAVAILIALCSDKDELVALCICCIPLYTTIQYTFIISVCLIIYCYRFGRGIKFNLSLILILVMMAWELLHCFTGAFALLSYVGIFVPFVLCAVLMYDTEYRADYYFIVQMFSVTTLVMCVVLLSQLVVASGFNIVLALSNLRRLGMGQNEGAELNPNTLGILCVLAVTGLIQRQMFHKKSRANIVQIVVLILFGMLTSSRTFLVCLAIMALLFLFGQKGGLARKLKFLGAILAVAVAALLLLYIFFPDLLEFYLERFQAEDISSGRTEIFKDYNEFLLSAPLAGLFGVGVQDFANKVTNVYRVSFSAPHNGMQELVVAWGFPGLAMFAIFLLILVRSSVRKSGRHTLISYIPLLILLAKAQVGQVITSSYTMLAFTYAYLSLAQSFPSERAQAGQAE